MQTIENDTNYAEIAIKPYYVRFSHTFNQLLMLSQNLLKTSSFDIHFYMRVPLDIVAGKVSRTLMSGFSVSGAATNRVVITTSNSFSLNLVTYTTCGNINIMSTSCGFKLSMN